MDLTYKQTDALELLEDDHTTELLFGGGAGGAKSVLGAYWHLKRRIQLPGTRGLIGRAKLKTLKETTLNSFFEVCQMQGIREGSHYTYNSTMGLIKYMNGSETLLKDLFAYPSDPNFDELGSLEITDAFIDEANQVSLKAVHIVKSRIRHRLEEFNLIPKILLCCNPAKNWTYSDFYKPHRDGTLPPYRAFIQALAKDNPHLSPHYIEQLKKLDENSQQRLLYGNWEYDDDPTSLMDFDALTDLFTNGGVKEGERYITADVARFGSDLTVIMLWSGLRVEQIVVLPSSSVTETAARIRTMATEKGVPMSRTVVDDDGVGGGVTDILSCVGFVNNSKALKGENYANLKSQCAYLLADHVNDRKIWIQPDDHRDTIIEELEQVKMWQMDKDTKKQILPKERVKDHIGRSPDFSDALIMRMYFEVGSFGQYAVV